MSNPCHVLSELVLDRHIRTKRYARTVIAPASRERIHNQPSPITDPVLPKKRLCKGADSDSPEKSKQTPRNRHGLSSEQGGLGAHLHVDRTLGFQLSYNFLGCLRSFT